jgi:hypothetical protein
MRNFVIPFNLAVMTISASQSPALSGLHYVAFPLK